MINQKNIEVKISKTDKPVPVIDGIHLHSSYNPEKEAESFCTQNEELLKKNNHVLIFGMGFGYHVKNIQYYLKKEHKDYKVFVIEPNPKTLELAHEHNIEIENENTKVFSFNSLDEYYRNSELVNFLVQKPGIISHPASFKLYQDFFKSFMTYKASRKTEDILPLIENEELKDCFYSANKKSLKEFLLTIDQEESAPSPETLLLKVYREIITTNGTGAIND